VNDVLLPGDWPAPDDESARKALADEIRTELWPHIAFIREQIALWISDHRTPVDLFPTPARSLTLREKCAALAAFHDSVEEGEPFWEDRDENVSQLPTTLSWQVLVSAAIEISPRPRDPLRTLLKGVVQALSQTEKKRTATNIEQHRKHEPHDTKVHITSMALAELNRIAAQLRALLGSQIPAIGLLSWTQELTGYAGETHRAIALADAAGALNGDPQNIVWCGAVTWRQPQPLWDENGDVRKTPLLDHDGHPSVVDGKQILCVQETAAEYRGIMAIDQSHRADSRFLPSALKTGFSGGTDMALLQCMRAAGEALARIPLANDKLWTDAALFPDARTGDGPLVLWLSALVSLHDRDVLIGDLVKPFRHWKVENPSSFAFAKPEADCLGIDTTRRVAVIRDPVKASLQLIDWLVSLSKVAPAPQPSSRMGTTIDLFDPNIRLRQCQLAFADAFAANASDPLVILSIVADENGQTKLPSWSGGSLQVLGPTRIDDGGKLHVVALALFVPGPFNADFQPWLQLARQSGAALLADARIEGVDQASDPAAIWVGQLVKTLWRTEWRLETEYANVSQFLAFAASVETWKRVSSHIVLGQAPIVNAADPEATQTVALLPEIRESNSVQDLIRSVRNAYLAYEYAVSENQRELQDREAYDYLKEHGLPSDTRDLGELEGYRLPSFDTWSRQVRDARRQLGQQKYSRRANRTTGRSITHQDRL
jgi:hypothetical protein